jgi:hypothetical protein
MQAKKNYLREVIRHGWTLSRRLSDASNTALTGVQILSATVFSGLTWAALGWSKPDFGIVLGIGIGLWLVFAFGVLGPYRAWKEQGEALEKAENALVPQYEPEFLDVSNDVVLMVIHNRSAAELRNVEVRLVSVTDLGVDKKIHLAGALLEAGHRATIFSIPPRGQARVYVVRRALRFVPALGGSQPKVLIGGTSGGDQDEIAEITMPRAKFEILVQGANIEPRTCVYEYDNSIFVDAPHSMAEELIPLADAVRRFGDAVPDVFVDYLEKAAAQELDRRLKRRAYQLWRLAPLWVRNVDSAEYRPLAYDEDGDLWLTFENAIPSIRDGKKSATTRLVAADIAMTESDLRTAISRARADPGLLNTEFISLSEAAHRVYQTLEGGGGAGAAIIRELEGEDALSWCAKLLVDRKSQVRGTKPPSRTLQLIPEQEFTRLKILNGAEALGSDKPWEPPIFTELCVRGSDLDLHIEEIRRTFGDGRPEQP